MPVAAVAAFAISAMEVVEVGLLTLQGLTMVGSGLSLVGQLTGNESLAKIGGVMAIGGGIANFANSVASAGASAAEVGSAAADTASIADTVGAQNITGNVQMPEWGYDAAQAGQQTMSEAASAADALQSGGNTLADLQGGDSGGILSGNSPLDSSMSAESYIDSGQMGAGPGTAEASAPTNSEAYIDNGGMGGNGQSVTPDAQGGTPSTSGTQNAPGAVKPSGNASFDVQKYADMGKYDEAIKAAKTPEDMAYIKAKQGEGGILSKASSFIKDNKELIGMAGKGAEALLGKGERDAKIGLYDSQAGLYNAKTAELNANMANANNLTGLNVGFSANPNAKPMQVARQPIRRFSLNNAQKA